MQNYKSYIIIQPILLFFSILYLPTKQSSPPQSKLPVHKWEPCGGLLYVPCHETMCWQATDMLLFLFLNSYFDYVGKGTIINLHQRIISKNNIKLLITFLIMDNSDYNKVENKEPQFMSQACACYLRAQLRA